MKTLIKTTMLSLIFLIAGGMAAFAQEQAEVPGDNFSLEGALELFKKSSSPEEFEKLLNSPDSKVNNLDLNGDGYIDYIRVFDRNEGNVHTFILQAVISDTESQDIAVIELEKKADGKAVLQIVGNADIYGVETIIEPTSEVKTYAGTTTTHTVVNVWAWPFVQYVYGPYYTSLWISPWSYAYYPYWWHPWRPVAYYVYDPWWRPYRTYYSVCYEHRIVYAPHIYRPYRTTSVYVHHRYNTEIVHYRDTHHDYDHRGRDRNDGGRTRYTHNDGDNGGRHHNSSGYGNSTGRQRTEATHSGSGTWSGTHNREFNRTSTTRSDNNRSTYGNSNTSRGSMREFNRTSTTRQQTSSSNTGTPNVSRGSSSNGNSHHTYSAPSRSTPNVSRGSSSSGNSHSSSSYGTSRSSSHSSGSYSAPSRSSAGNSHSSSGSSHQSYSRPSTGGSSGNSHTSGGSRSSGGSSGGSRSSSHGRGR